MKTLYPSWIEIPALDLDRALAFYRAVFALADIPMYDEEPGTRIAVLLPSDKKLGRPGISLVLSPRHVACGGGVQINFHVGDHAALAAALAAATAHGGTIAAPVAETADGIRYALLRDSEGNPIAISSFEPGHTGD